MKFFMIMSRSDKVPVGKYIVNIKTATIPLYPKLDDALTIVNCVDFKNGLKNALSRN